MNCSGRFGEPFHEVDDDFFLGGLESIGADWAGKFFTPGLTERSN
jgi:hypothetical protein